jgi:hypothetical protein
MEVVGIGRREELKGLSVRRQKLPDPVGSLHPADPPQDDGRRREKRINLGFPERRARVEDELRAGPIEHFEKLFHPVIGQGLPDPRGRDDPALDERPQAGLVVVSGRAGAFLGL